MERALERNIVLDCQRGKLERFGELYDLYVKKIYNFIYFKTFHKETAEDLTSESFFKALKNIGKFDTSLNFSSWIYKIAQNTVIDHYRTFRRTEDIDDVWDLEDDNDFVEKLDDRLCFERVKKHLSQLPSLQRDIIMMRVWQDMPYKEIAAAVGRSEENCKVIFSRAIAQLRQLSLAAMVLLIIMKI